MENKAPHLMDLRKIISDVERIFPYESIDKIKLNENYTNKYFKKSNLGYKLFHSKEGSVHMAISEGDTFHEADYLAQVNVIENRLKQINKKEIKVLELGCGMGFNIHYLATKFQNVSFTGIDITEKHLKQTKAKTKSLKNVSIRKMSFDDFNFENEQFDLIYEIEAACYTRDFNRLLSNIHGLLFENGRFITFQGFRNTRGKSLTNDEVKLVNYLEKSMAVAEGIELSDWLEVFRATFTNVEENDISNKITPNLKRFNYLAGRYFRRPVIAKCINTLVSKELVMNAIAGYLFLYCVQYKYHVYYHMEGVKSND